MTLLFNSPAVLHTDRQLCSDASFTGWQPPPRNKSISENTCLWYPRGHESGILQRKAITMNRVVLRARAVTTPTSADIEMGGYRGHVCSKRDPLLQSLGFIVQMPVILQSAWPPRRSNYRPVFISLWLSFSTRDRWRCSTHNPAEVIPKK